MAEETACERRARIRHQHEEQLERQAAEHEAWLAGHPDRAPLLALNLASELFVADDGYGSVAVHTNEQAVDILLSSEWLAAHDAQVKVEGWDEGCAAGLSRGLDIAELRTGPLDLTMVPPPPTNPYRAAETEPTR